MNDEARLQQAAEIAAGAPVVLCARTFVMESVGPVLWQGEVSVFETQGRRRVYAWPVERTNEATEYVAFLHQPPIDSPLAAFRDWMKNPANRSARVS